MYIHIRICVVTDAMFHRTSRLYPLQLKPDFVYWKGPKGL